MAVTPLDPDHPTDITPHAETFFWCCRDCGNLGMSRGMTIHYPDGDKVQPAEQPKCSACAKTMHLTVESEYKRLSGVGNAAFKDAVKKALAK